MPKVLIRIWLPHEQNSSSGQRKDYGHVSLEIGAAIESEKEVYISVNPPIENSASASFTNLTTDKKINKNYSLFTCEIDGLNIQKMKDAYDKKKKGVQFALGASNLYWRKIFHNSDGVKKTNCTQFIWELLAEGGLDLSDFDDRFRELRQKSQPLKKISGRCSLLLSGLSGFLAERVTNYIATNTIAEAYNGVHRVCGEEVTNILNNQYLSSGSLAQLHGNLETVSRQAESRANNVWLGGVLVVMVALPILIGGVYKGVKHGVLETLSPAYLAALLNKLADEKQQNHHPIPQRFKITAVNIPSQDNFIKPDRLGR